MWWLNLERAEMYFLACASNSSERLKFVFTVTYWLLISANSQLSKLSRLQVSQTFKHIAEIHNYNVNRTTRTKQLVSMFNVILAIL